jgi:hypothetical protein
MTETIILNRSADHQLSTSKPLTRLAAHFIIRIFITNKNRPSVSKVIGKVRITSIGFMNVFSNANTNATIMVVVTSVMATPGRR